VNIDGEVYIGSGVEIEPGVTIQGPTWIGSGSHLREGSTVVRSVLFEYTRIAQAQTFHEMIVAPHYCVDRAGTTFYIGDETCPLRWGDARG
jgi:mannose-1-phosphate guanylyltransferase